ncbi:endoplasmic reticulum junction formation protein lunapark-B-like [Plectropomus leopardus]|uniref:endoplasmic reticulum junction formation protein lunapark-B-like n=1 Tax=Plectropomus leopardus TaxID=160734 RepID=UPI001C4DBBB5|nr:endoplasmic reticulum junction formation protein lunapark-B-like [Plectropomus leopardus]
MFELSFSLICLKNVGQGKIEKKVGVLQKMLSIKMCENSEYKNMTVEASVSLQILRPPVEGRSSKSTAAALIREPGCLRLSCFRNASVSLWDVALPTERVPLSAPGGPPERSALSASVLQGAIPRTPCSPVPGVGLHPPGPPLARPILPKDRGAVDRVIEYLVGDGPQNR